jgi:hypothetical protein
MSDEAIRLAFQTEANLAELLARRGVHLSGDDRRKLVWALQVVRELTV